MTPSISEARWLHHVICKNRGAKKTIIGKGFLCGFTEMLPKRRCMPVLPLLVTFLGLPCEAVLWPLQQTSKQRLQLLCPAGTHRGNRPLQTTCNVCASCWREKTWLWAWNLWSGLPLQAGDGQRFKSSAHGEMLPARSWIAPKVSPERLQAWADLLVVSKMSFPAALPSVRGKRVFIEAAGVWHHASQPNEGAEWADEETPRRWISSTLLPRCSVTRHWMNYFTALQCPCCE